jgi:uncharacterized protein
MNLEFEWDDDKADQNLIKHGVQFEEAETVFRDPNLYTEFDTQHSSQEERYVNIGFSNRGRLLLVVHTMRQATIRIITARPCTTKEARFYDQR